MKVNYRPNSRMVFEVEADTHQALWEQLAEIDELYSEASMTCQKKDKGCTKNVKFVVRQDDEENKYYELQCAEPIGHPLFRVKRAYGCNKKGGGLFPKRKDADGAFLKDDGWVQWNPETKQEE